MKNSAKLRRRGGLFVLGSLYPEVTGGMEIFNYYFLNCLLNRSDLEVFYLGKSKTGNGKGHFVFFKKYWPVRLFYPVQFFLAVLKLRKQIGFAYLSFAEQSWIMTYSQGLVLHFFRIPYIVTIHCGNAPRWKFKYPVAYYFRNAHAVIGVSVPVCESFKKFIPNQNFQFIPPLVPFQKSRKPKGELRKTLGFDLEEKMLLFVGTLKAMKNPDKIIEAFTVLGAGFLEEQKIRLVFAGEGHLQSELREMVKNAQLERFIQFAGLISRELIPDYFAAADAYIISSDYEGTSLSVLEAMFNGLPIIASDAPGLNKMLENEQNALLYHTENATELARAIKRIFTDLAFATFISANAQMEFKRRYSYEEMIAKYESIFATANDTDQSFRN